MLLGNIISLAQKTLIDPNGDRWSRTAELLAYANDAVKEIVGSDPTAGAKRVAFQLASGSKQKLPADGEILLNIEHNLGADGLTVGRGILIADRVHLTRIDPLWPATVGSYVELYVYDERYSKEFYVYPRPTGTWYVQLLYAAIPEDLTAATIDSQAMEISDLYGPAIHDYVVARALMKHNLSADLPRSSAFFNRFYSQIGRSLQGDARVSPVDADITKQSPGQPGKP